MSVVLTGANRPDKIAAMDLIVSVMVKRPVHNEQHLLCADKAYEAKDVREFVALEGYEDHIKVNPRKAAQSDDDDDALAEKEGSEEQIYIHRERSVSGPAHVLLIDHHLSGTFAQLV